ncbi:leucyl/phenylalanyl-tRNA--protein transferase [Streptomyces sp. NPDC050095]|uniref:leucyl/phenylalanyl-tRNA--protein transferase n=1 Tax=unclassified Streptomyces TaxID=2593676 RepID=UPI0034312DF5
MVKTLDRATPGATTPWDHAPLGSGLGVPVAVGGDLTAESVLAAHLRGVFCLPRSETSDIADNEATYAPDVEAGDIRLLPCASNPYSILWWSPHMRYVIPTAELALGRTTRQALRPRPWTTTVNADFDGVLNACRGTRRPRWITEPLMSSLRELRQDGWAKSIEVWDGDQLVGGLFGLALNRVFVMSSAFHRQPNAAKAAMADLARRTAAGNIRLLDAQVRTEYTVRLGSRAIPRAEYLQWLDPAERDPGILAEDRQDVQRLLARPQTR